MAENPYEVMGILPTASDQEIERAYQDLLARYDPNRYDDPEEKAEAIREGLAVKTAYRKLKGQNRQTFDFAGQVPEERTWAMQRGRPFRSPPPQAGEQVIVVGPERDPEAGIVDRPPSWRQWWGSLILAALGSIPLLLAVVAIYMLLSWGLAGARTFGAWVVVALGLLPAGGLGVLGALPAYRLWLLLTQLRPGKTRN